MGNMAAYRTIATGSYWMSLPPDASGSVGLIIAMHGLGGSGTRNSFAGLNTPAFAKQLAVIEPNGINDSWNVGAGWDRSKRNDANFIRAVINAVTSEIQVDAERIYACGMSNGGYMAYELIGYLYDIITAFGSVTGNFMLNDSQALDYRPPRRIPLIHIHGTWDWVVGYYPGSDPDAYRQNYGLSVQESIQFWRNHNGEDTETVTQMGYTTKYVYTARGDGCDIVHYKVERGGHIWEMSGDFDTNEVLVDFFDGYRLSDFKPGPNILDLATMINLGSPRTDISEFLETLFLE